MNDFIITVVVPVYNAEKTINRCVDSILNQTHSNLELLLIDDGSTDRSAELCRQYADRDQRVRYYYQENSGVSAARNRGIDLARGEYVSFVDSDDWLELNALETLYLAAYQHHAEIVLPRCVGDYYSRNGNFEKSVYDNDEFECVVTRQELPDKFEKLRSASTCYSVCGRLYLRAFLNKHKLRFDPEIRVLEDFCFVLNCLSYMTATVHVNRILYHYTVVNSAEYRTKRKYEAFFHSIPKVYETLFSFLDKQDIHNRGCYYDFIIGYWVLGIESMLKTEESLQKRAELFHLCTKHVKDKGLFENCNKENLSRPYHVLFKTGSVQAFLLARKMKEMKEEWL